jgi:NurA-like 5'-3' nuclease
MGFIMLESMYDIVLSKKEIINQKIDSYPKLDRNISNTWKNWKTIPFTENNAIIAAGDGSKHEIKFLGFYFYAISAESLVFNDQSGEKLSKIQSIDVDTMPNNRYAKERIRNYMGLFEVKNGIKTLQNYKIDYYLYDGSILGDLIRPLPLEKEIPQKIRKEILNLSYNKLKEELDEGNVEVSSTKIANILLNSMYKSINDYNPDIYLETIEKLLTLRKLLEYKDKIVAISKRSTANDYFKTNVPDIAIFNAHSKEIGFSDPIIKHMSSSIKHEFPVENDFFKNLEFTIFYLRIEKNKNILKVELPYKADNDDIERIISAISKNSVEGYPFLLKKAHHDVVIKKKDIEQLSKIVGFYEKTGREML